MVEFSCGNQGRVSIQQPSYPAQRTKNIKKLASPLVVNLESRISEIFIFKS